jgi:mono/diheme cytochrome c family protein
MLLMMVFVLCLGAAYTALAQSEEMPGMPNPASDDPVERGQYLFYIEYGCIGCHAGPNADGSMPENPGMALPTGGEPFDLGALVVYAANVTQVGDWSAEELETTIRYGLSPDGEWYAPIMGFRLYENITDDQMSDLIAYLQSMEPVENEVPEIEFRDPSLSRVIFARDVEIDIDAERLTPDFSDPVIRGGYLANVAHCMSCHGQLGPDFVAVPWPEGLPHGFVGPTLLPAGVADLTDEELYDVIANGRIEQGMPPHFFPEEDVNALIAWIRALPDVEPMPMAFPGAAPAEGDPAATPES